ncbi:MAG TPA: ABC transporter substrate-binding protein [Opitutaceae bacterium]|nr:ABC transporter substrate-binding protein [Opitutaceae bacterium]
MTNIIRCVLLWLAVGSVTWATGAKGIRVVSQTVGTDEMLLALAEPEQIAALSQIADDEAFSAVATQAKAYPKLSIHGDAESILKYQPTLVLFADYSRSELVAQVKRSGVAVLVFDRYKSLEDSYDNLRRLAKAIGAETKAERVIADCEARVKNLREKLKGVRRIRVIAPSTYGAIPGSDTTFQDLCDYAGAENLAATIGKLVGHTEPPGEKMLTWPIEKVVIAGATAESALKPYEKLPPYQFMPAVKQRRVALLKPYQLSCVSHYRIDGYEQLARELHPDVFK